MKKSTLTLVSLVAATQWGFYPPVFGQDDTEEADVFELSPFQVDSSNDRGYRAENTLAGSRMNTSLVDVASSVSVYTEAFIEDLGIQSLDELADYTANMYLNYDEDQLGGPSAISDREATKAEDIDQKINIRGVAASKGMDYFRSITPSDGYRTGRYDESRGPNGILFGSSGAGGITNATSIGASTQRNNGRFRITHEDTGGFRTELRFNRVLVEDKFAIAIAAVNTENEEWQVNTYDDGERIFGTTTYKVNDKLTIRTNYESGTKSISNQSRAPAIDFGGITLYDWTNYYIDQGMDLEDLYIVPRNNNNEDPNNPENAGFPADLYTRRTNNANNSARYITITNNGTTFNTAGTFTLRPYSETNSLPPPDAVAYEPPTLNSGRYRIDMPELLPRYVNTDGPGATRNWDFQNHSAFLDFKVNENFYINLAHNKQSTDLQAHYTAQSNFSLYGDINTTLGLDYAGDGTGGSRNPGYGSNPYVGQWYLESSWRRDNRNIDLETTRLSMSYDLDTERFGNHKIAAMFSKSNEWDTRLVQQLAMLERPFSIDWSNANNRVNVRTYFDWNDPVDNPESFHIGHWDQLVGTTILVDNPQTETAEAEEIEVGWTNVRGANSNRISTQEVDTRLFAMHSYWLNRRLVTSLGVRQDTNDITQFPLLLADRDNVNLDPDSPIQFDVFTDEELIYGPNPRLDLPELNDQFASDATTSVFGTVFHLNDNFRLMANFSDNVGFPNFERTLMPTGIPSPPPEGVGLDYGLGFQLFENRISGRIVYYELEEQGRPIGAYRAGPYDDVVSSLGDQLIELGIMSETEWTALDEQEQMTRTWNGDVVDKYSRGVEITLNANITDNWRLTFKASKTDRIVTNYLNRLVEHYGLLPNLDAGVYQDWDQVINPFEEVSDGEWILADPDGLDPDGLYSQFLQFATDITNATEDTTDNVGNYETINGRTLMQEMDTVIRGVNDNRVANGKRWGLRPYNANVFTAYDFSEGFLKGFSVGGGLSWKDNMIIGEDEVGLETWYSRELWDTNAMLRYKWRNGFGPFEGPVTLQLNVRNVLDDQDIIPIVHGRKRGPIAELPYDRGTVWGRFDVPMPRSWRLTATFEF